MSVSFTWNGGEVAAEGAAGAARGLALAAEHLKAVAVDLTPEEEGTLRRSAVASTDGLEAAVSFDTVYAVRQHEELDWNHKVGQAKYLETPLFTERENMAELLATEIRRALGT